eukprot:Colp12_sorted_trinity150504_noHs@11652
MAIYDEEKAKQGVREVHAKLMEIHEVARRHETAHPEEVLTAHNKYMTLPITWQINWQIAGFDAAEMQTIADEAREKINSYHQRLGSNALPLPRAFNGNA